LSLVLENEVETFLSFAIYASTLFMPPHVILSPQLFHLHSPQPLFIYSHPNHYTTHFLPNQMSLTFNLSSTTKIIIHL